MGNEPQTKPITYNKPENPSQLFGPNYTGPFIHPSVSSFSDIVNAYANRSLIDNTLEKMKLYSARPCIGFRKLIAPGKYDDKYTYYTYHEIETFCMRFAKNIHSNATKLLAYDTYNNIDFKLIGIFSKNCTEWVITDNACQMDSITTVTLYATLGEEAFDHICKETLIKTICVSPDLVDMLIKCKTKFNIETLQNVLLFDMTTNITEKEVNEIQTKLKNAGIEMIRFTSMIKENDSVKESDLTISKPDTVMTICYTSGTTGLPKGVMIIQRNMIAMLEMCIKDSGIPLDENGCHFSFLPLAHIMERIIMSGFMSVAARIGFISGNVHTTLLDDLSLLKPTLLFLVPKVLTNLRAKIMDKLNALPPFKRRIAFKAIQTKQENFERYGVVSHYVYDKIVFNQIRKVFGGNLRAVLSASAPLPKRLADDFKIFLSVPIVEGWGMTELTGPAFATSFYDLSNNSAGGVISTSNMILYDVPQLGYTHSSPMPSGEICIRGPSTCIGYYKKPKETAETIDENGYLHTGDIGLLTEHGVRIVDRVKEIFKLSQGEYIIPNKLENVYEKSKYVNNILIYGNSLKNNIVGVVVPNLKHCANFLGKDTTTYQEIKASEALRDEIKKDFLQLASEASFNSLEKLEYFVLTEEEFSISNGCITPTLKMVRKKIEQKYKDEIEEVYKAIPLKVK